jgi:hypothetical protein
MWIDGEVERQGRDFAPGFDPANYTRVLAGSFPTANVFIEDGVSSPVAREFTLSAGRQLWNRGAAKLTYTSRNYSNMIEDFTDDPSNAGRTNVVFNGTNFGTFDNIVFRNSDIPERDYQALLFQANYRLMSRLSLEGHWTLQLRNHGNFEDQGGAVRPADRQQPLSGVAPRLHRRPDIPHVSGFPILDRFASEMVGGVLGPRPFFLAVSFTE